MYLCLHVCIYVCMYLCMYVCMYVFTYVCIYVCIYVHIRTYVCMYLSTYRSEPLLPLRVCTSWSLPFSFSTLELTSLRLVIDNAESCIKGLIGRLLHHGLTRLTWMGRGSLSQRRLSDQVAASTGRKAHANRNFRSNLPDS